MRRPQRNWRAAADWWPDVEFIDLFPDVFDTAGFFADRNAYEDPALHMPALTASHAPRKGQAHRLKLQAIRAAKNARQPVAKGEMLSASLHSIHRNTP